MEQRTEGREIQECLAVIKVMNALGGFMTNVGFVGTSLSPRKFPLAGGLVCRGFADR